MKIVFSMIAILLFLGTSYAQSRTISKDEYDKVFKFAVSKTNADYPLIFKVVTAFIENGKTVRTNTEVNENEAAGRYIIIRTVPADGRKSSKYQLTVDFGNVFCSDDGVTSKPSKYECPSERMIYGNREAESIEYNVSEKPMDGKKIKIYREFSVFAQTEGNKPKKFNEKISTIDSRGYFITVVDTEGTLALKTITLTKKHSWGTQAMIEPIVSHVK